VTQLRPRTAAALLALALPASCATPRDAVATCPASRDWGAHIDLAREGSSELRLYVHGKVDVPPGMVAKLRPGPLDRMIPPTQRFSLELRHGRGAAGPQVIGGHAPASPMQYREILISCGGETIGRVDGSDIETAD